MVSGMFYIVALVYVIVAGQPVIDEPVKIPHAMVFKDLDACQAFLKSDTFAFQRAALADMLHQSINLPREEDQSPPDFAVTITASCEEDHRI